MKSSRIACGLWALALLAGCGPKLGPPTHQYLTDACGALAQLDRDLAKETVPKAPALPSLTGLTVQAQGEALEAFSAQLTQYDTAAGQASDRVVALGDQAMAKLRALDAMGTDPAVAELVDRYKALVNQRQQMAVNVQAMISGQRSALRKGMVPRYARRLLIGGVESMFMPGDRLPAEVDPAAAEFKPAPDEKSEATAQNLSIQRAISSWRHNIADAAALRATLAADLKAKYGDLDWSFLTQ